MADAAVIVEQAAALRWRRAIMAGFGLGGITVSAWGPRLPAVKAELGIGTATIGLLAAGVTMGAIAGLVVSTPLLHRLGSRGGVTVSLLTVAAGMAVMP
jgi:cyanate permease